MVFAYRLNRLNIGRDRRTPACTGRAGLPGAVAALICVAVPALGADTKGVEEVVVTARHRAEKAQTVPIGLTSVSSSKLKANAISSVTNLQFVVPTLQVTEFNPRNTSFNIRGVGNNVSVSNDGLESGVGVYVDGVFIARPGIAAFDFPDIDSVQVLRGPQGTLFGKNTTSGAIDVRTALPSFKPQAELEASLGNYGYWQVKGTVSDGFNDKVAARVSFLGDERDGTITSIPTGSHYDTLDDKAVRVQVLAIPTDDLTLRFITDYAHQLQNCCVNMASGVFTTLTDGKPIANNFYQREKRLDYAIPNLNPFTYDTDIANKTYFEMETAGGSLQADYNLHDITLTSISAARLWNWWPYNGANVGVGLPVTLFGNQNDWQRQITQEFRATSTVGNFDYTAGVFFFYQDIQGFSHTGYGPDGGNYFFGNQAPKVPLAVSKAALNGFNIDANTDPVTNSYSGYGQATYHFTPRLSFTGGLRYVYEDKSGSYNQVTDGGIPLADLPVGEQATVRSLRTAVGGTRIYYNSHTHNGSVGWLTTLSYKLTNDLFAYATYSRGTKSPGVQVTNLPAGVNPIVKPERDDNYEIGLKSSLFDNRLTGNIDVFWEEDSDYQGIETSPLNSSGTVFATYSSSVPKVQTRGFELDTNARPVDWLSLNFGGAYTEGIYESYPNGQCPVEQVGSATKICNLTGKVLPGNSLWTMAAGGEASQPIGTYFQHESAAYFGADFSLRSSFFVAANDSITSRIPGYGLLDLRAGVRTVDGKYDLFFWAHNATNTRYYLVRGTTAPFSGLTYGNIGDPATFGATLRVRFQ
jgi:iron complex outermembrane receptor protein